MLSLYLFFSFFLFFLSLFFFFFFLNHMIIVLGYKSCMQLMLSHRETPNYPWEKANPPSPSDVEATAHLAPKKKPLTS